MELYLTLLIKEVLHHKGCRHRHRNHRRPCCTLDPPAKAIDEESIKHSIQSCPDEHGDHCLVGVARGTHDCIKAKAERREDIPRDHDL